MILDTYVSRDKPHGTLPSKTLPDTQNINKYLTIKKNINCTDFTSTDLMLPLTKNTL